MIKRKSETQIRPTVTPHLGVDEAETGIQAKSSDPDCDYCHGSGEVSVHLSAEDHLQIREVRRRQDEAKAQGEDDEESLLCKICWGYADFGLSTECEHLYCTDCIRGTLEAILQTGQFPAICPQCRAENDLSAASGARLLGRISPLVLAFLQQRG